MRISVKAPAKINLTLDVVGKRADGYHEVEMVMTTIDLADRIDIYPREDDQITIDCSAYFVPLGEKNLVYQVAKIIKDKLGIKQGVHFYIHKRIPIAAGLAGGSADAAAAIRGLNNLWQLGLSVQEMAEIGSKVGSDVAFCVYGGTALAQGRGEQITTLPSPPPAWVVLAKPPIAVSTSEIYGKTKMGEITAYPRRSERMIDAINNRDYNEVYKSLGNHLETVTLSLYPEVRKIKEQMLRFGADASLMSGSGPTVFCLVDKESRVGRIYNGLRGFCSDVYAVRIIGERSYAGLPKTVQK
ncbi:4-(cytidine 5'-diphospho)-2-C-methyl-D-erythritol kinase [Ammoniphilus oxalaticus]|uniref:4-diphosphocytidyl-2-C-methyl-D-erythritol kinase n=1 Tax=Ammoniphilus oxalaticus TaxID=66863 RepID=A0A419SGC9_9BACL|nr:4-(cytidine 5'-diphospho)-2-C-methyl-D-erythritol kinase [Ammoniphilus oxalaticus]RKD22805.1 4-(cytidine 5'-diphospho)-2-C-methyl-D-erythritol kinase [Ammoniphilus oxalaticus]